MATWVTHLMIADQILSRIDSLDVRGFCVGNIAPDCNLENEDWTSFTPSREVTHWMKGDRKTASDCEGFYDAYLVRRSDEIQSSEHRSFLMGYYAHLLTDAAFQQFIRDKDRVAAAWKRIHNDPVLGPKAAGHPETWDSIKKIVPKNERIAQIYGMEAQYLAENPQSGYLTQIVPLREFPDYIDYLPHGAIARKIGVMGFIPEIDPDLPPPITMTREEYIGFVSDTVEMVIAVFHEKGLI